MALLLTAMMFGVIASAQVEQSPISKENSGRTSGHNDRIITTGIRSPPQAANHALIITVSAYPRRPLPGVLKDRAVATQLAERFGVPPENITYLSEEAVTREGLQQAIDKLGKTVLDGDKLYIYFSGHGARFENKTGGQCIESLVMQDRHVVTNDEFADMVRPLSAKADKTVVMLDACHAGGVAESAGTRDVDSAGRKPKARAKFDAEASSAACANPVNMRGFSNARGIEFETTDNNLVILAAARKDEVAWDTDAGGAMTHGFLQCVDGDAVDHDGSGSISMQELADCVQAHLNRDEDQGVRQHLTLTGNGGLIPAFSPSPAATSTPKPPVPQAEVNTLAALGDIYGQRDDRWGVTAVLSKPVLTIGTDFLDFTVTSQRDGFLYIFYLGSRPESFYLLFPNQLDAQNSIKANEPVTLPRRTWTVSAGGPAGTDHLLVMVTDTPRDLGDYSLPADYISRSGPYGQIPATAQSVARINEIATLSTALKNPECQSGLGRNPDIARRCSNVFGAALLSVVEQQSLGKGGR
jgi:uncharacterized ParB-like nuclease family protein